MKNGKRLTNLLIVLFSVVMLVGLLPTTVMAEEPTYTEWTSTDAMPTAAGYYYLSGDVTLNILWSTPAGDIFIDLKGHNITASDYCVIDVKSDTTLSIIDSVGNGSINNTAAENVNATYSIYNSGTVSISGGIVSSAGDESNMYGIYNNGGIVNVSGTAQVKGETGGIWNSGAVNISGGSVVGGWVGILNATGGTVNVTGGEVIGTETASFAIQNSGSVTVSNTGKVNGYSGGVHNFEDAEITVNGGSVTGKMYGILNIGHVAINGGDIKGGADSISNVSYGIMNEGSVVINGGTVAGGYYNAGAAGYGIWNDTNASATISGGTITGTTYISSETKLACGIYIDTSTVTVNGGTVKGTDRSGGGSNAYGVFVNDGSLNLGGDFTITVSSGGKDIYLASTDDVIIIENVLTFSDVISVSMKTLGVFTYGWDTYMSSADSSNYFVSAYAEYVVLKETSSSELMLSEKPPEAKWGASADALTESGTLADALSEAQGSNTDIYIQLQSDAELSRPYSFEKGTDVMITLDLNGHDISASLSGYNRLFGIGDVGSGGSTYGNLTLTDTSSGDKGSITANAYIVYMYHGSTLRIGSGISVVSTGGYALRFEGGTVTVEEGGFSATSADSNAIYMNGATLNGNNISFTAITNSDYYSTAAIYVDQGDVTGLNATVTGPTALSLGHSYSSKIFNVEITGGTYTGTQYYAIVINNESGENSSLSLKGGTFVADTEADGVINLYDSGTVLNTYGALLAENYAYTDGVSPAAITNETKLSEARTLVVKNKSELPTGKTIISIEKTATNGLVDTYTVTYDDGSTYEFTVTNGKAGQPGENGNHGKTPTFKIETGELKVSYDDGSTWTSLGNVTGTPGATGREVQLQVNGGYIQWKYEGDSAWTNLVSLETLVGSDGREVTFRVEDGYIQWQYVGDTTWTNLISLGSLTGEKGDKGDDGREVTFRVEDGYIQWQYVGDTTWTNLISLGSLTGEKGDKGDDGREVTFQVANGYHPSTSYQYRDKRVGGFLRQWHNLDFSRSKSYGRKR